MAELNETFLLYHEYFPFLHDYSRDSFNKTIFYFILSRSLNTIPDLGFSKEEKMLFNKILLPALLLHKQKRNSIRTKFLGEKT